MGRTLRIAAAQYSLGSFREFEDYEIKIRRWVMEAVEHGAELVVFPEYGAMELCSIGGRGRGIADSMEAVSDLIPQVDRIHAALAAKYRITIVAGSAPQRRVKKWVNVVHIFGPNGLRGTYDKIMPTPGERSLMGISGGRQLRVFSVGKARVGLLICYDIEFPLLSRALAESGAEVILAPSDTETEWGYWRVRTGALARALENQVYTVHASLVGPAPFCLVCENNTGAAGVFAPSDRGFPPGGVISLGEMNKPQWVYASVDFDLIAEVREKGSVQTYRHWGEQPGAMPLPAAEVIDISGHATNKDLANGIAAVPA